METLPPFKPFPLLSDRCQESLALVQVRLENLGVCNKTGDAYFHALRSLEATLLPIPNASPCTHPCVYRLTPAHATRLQGSKAVSDAIPNLTILTIWNVSLFTFPISIFGTKILIRKQIYIIDRQQPYAGTTCNPAHRVPGTQILRTTLSVPHTAYCVH